MNPNEQPSPSELDKAIEYFKTVNIDKLMVSEQTLEHLVTILKYAKQVRELQKQHDAFEHKIIELSCKGTDTTRFDSVAEMQVATLYKWWKESEHQLLAKDALIERLVEALNPFCPGVRPVSWGQIKANMSTEAARQLTRFNVTAEEALSLAHEQGYPKGNKDVLTDGQTNAA